MRRGFTVLECLVALAILGAAAGSVYSTLGVIAAGARRATAELHAALLAGSLLDRLGIDLPLAEGQLDGPGWSVRTTRHGSDEDQQAWPLAAYDVRVTLAMGGPAPLHMATIRLGPKPPP